MKRTFCVGGYRVSRRPRHRLFRPQRWSRQAFAKGPACRGLGGHRKLHQIDIEFTRSQDKRLMDIWSDDAVRFMPGSPRMSASRPFWLTMRSSRPGTRVSRC
jgi:hypothetical protein